MVRGRERDEGDEGDEGDKGDKGDEGDGFTQDSDPIVRYKRAIEEEINNNSKDK